MIRREPIPLPKGMPYEELVGKLGAVERHRDALVAFVRWLVDSGTLDATRCPASRRQALALLEGTKS